MRGDPAGPHDWLDSDAGPVVRPYAVTGGRVQPTGATFDLLAFVVAKAPEGAGAEVPLQPEHRRIVGLAQQPVSVADLAADLDLALGVVRVLLGDLLAAGLIALYEPPASAAHPHDDILKAVVNGLRAL
ncbi:DUF742 domain-containing protein [Solwaraspora sp. WMMD792]|uniref:DUF742 domain-containing protein n=1 Tax=unclassified Solwaraspora TaxID=2627926 RepID=UPI00241749E0|nr:DUF742 domain-containing protein [Solwaraspora sp. WMMD792]MDG4769487.1 DUF742 domain-containing protein [Solwaraspora sp. WMMD792]